MAARYSSLQDRAAPSLESLRHRCDVGRLSADPRRVEDEDEDQDKGFGLTAALR